MIFKPSRLTAMLLAAGSLSLLAPSWARAEGASRPAAEPRGEQWGNISLESLVGCHDGVIAAFKSLQSCSERIHPRKDSKRRTQAKAVPSQSAVDDMEFLLHESGKRVSHPSNDSRSLVMRGAQVPGRYGILTIEPKSRVSNIPNTPGMTCTFQETEEASPESSVKALSKKEDRGEADVVCKAQFWKRTQEEGTLLSRLVEELPEGTAYSSCKKEFEKVAELKGMNASCALARVPAGTSANRKIAQIVQNGRAVAMPLASGEPIHGSAPVSASQKAGVSQSSGTRHSEPVAESRATGGVSESAATLRRGH